MKFNQSAAISVYACDHTGRNSKKKNIIYTLVLDGPSGSGIRLTKTKCCPRQYNNCLHTWFFGPKELREMADRFNELAEELEGG